MLKNKISFIFIFILLTGVQCISAPVDMNIEIAPHSAQSLNNSVNEAINNTQTVTRTIHVEDIKEMTPNANEAMKKEIVQDTDEHLKEVIFKFLIAMASVIVSAIIIFLICTVMNKVHNFKTGLISKKNEKELLQDKEDTSLLTEDNALKIFLDKTK